MPAHSQARGSAAPKAPKKKANGGRPLGKAALRALGKNADAVNSVLNLLEADESLSAHHFSLAKIVRPSGAGWMMVSFMGETEEHNMPIKGAVRFKGRSANKADRANCMTPGDVVVVEGAQIAGKVSRVASFVLRLHLERLRIPFPKKFFDTTAEAEEAEEQEEWEWDRDEDAEEAEAREEADRRAEEARAYRLRHGLAPTAEVDEDVAAVEAKLEAAEEEEVVFEEDAPAPAAAGGGSKAGPNRAERRAAEAAAKAATEEEAERRAFLIRSSRLAASEDKAVARLLSKDAWIDNI
jgi:hypothetical protein